MRDSIAVTQEPTVILGGYPEEQGISIVQHNGPKQILATADVHEEPSKQPSYLFFSDPNSVRSQTPAPPSAKASGLELLGSAMEDGSGTEQLIVSVNVSGNSSGSHQLADGHDTAAGPINRQSTAKVEQGNNASLKDFKFKSNKNIKTSVFQAEEVEVREEKTATQSQNEDEANYDENGLFQWISWKAVFAFLTA